MILPNKVRILPNNVRISNKQQSTEKVYIFKIKENENKNRQLSCEK